VSWWEIEKLRWQWATEHWYAFLLVLLVAMLGSLLLATYDGKSR
jgi:hypothetical protein